MRKWLLIISLFLTGCGGFVSKEALTHITESCKQNGGIKRIFVKGSLIGGVDATCNNGAQFEVYK